MYADLVDARGRPWEGCVRSALRRAVDRAAARGVSFQVGFEPEGYVFSGRDEGIAAIGTPQFATLDGLDRHEEYAAELIANLAAAGIDVEQWTKEYGAGQIEVNLRYGPALVSADRLATFKHLFRAIARRHGLLGTFMPKPLATAAGSGLHVHLSATPTGGEARNLFDDPGDTELALSTIGRQALAGLLVHGQALTALGASTVNSYKRFLPGSWAPTHVMFAPASRAAFVRLPERETARRLELRVGDPACNPYLYLTGILVAMLDGIERELDPGRPVPGNVGALSHGDAEAVGARALPRTLGEALDRLAEDDILRDGISPLIVDEYIKIKRSEWEAFYLHVGEWDHAWYLDRY
jgi:glutamine synthetase